MWFGSISSLKRSIEKQHEEKMKLIKLLEEQQKTLSELADALRKIATQQVKDNFTVKETIDKIVKEDTAKGLIKEAVTSMENAKSYHSRRASLLTYCDYYA